MFGNTDNLIHILYFGFCPHYLLGVGKSLNLPLDHLRSGNRLS